MDFGWRREGRGRQREKALDGAVHLDGGGEQAEIAGAGGGGGTIRNFTLDHEHGEVERGVAGGQLEQDGRGDVVRQIADDSEEAGADGVRAGSRGGKVEVEDVLFNDGEAIGGESFAEAGGELAVELDGEDMAGLGGKGASNGAAARANFDDGTAGEIAQRREDATDGACVGEKVLAEPGPGLHGCSDSSG